MRINRFELASKLKSLKSITPPKGNDSVAGVLFDKGKLTANNLDIAITTDIETQSNDTFVIPVKAIELIEKMSDTDIDISLSGNKLIVKSSKGRSSFATSRAEDFPTVTEIESSDIFEFESGEIFAEAVKSVMYACAVNSSRVTATGVLFEGDGEFLNIVASDGRRIAWNKIPCEEKLNVIIPKTTLQKVLPFCTENAIKLYQSGNRAVFDVGQFNIFTKTISGQFIKYQEVFAKNISDMTVTFSKHEALEIVSRALICANDGELSSIKLEIEESISSIEANSSTSDFHEDIEILDGGENPIKIGFNPIFVTEILKNIAGDKAKISYSTPETAIVVNPDEALKHLLLPVRLKGENI